MVICTREWDFIAHAVYVSLWSPLLTHELLSTQVSQAVVKFVHHAQSQGLFSNLKRIPAKLNQHATNAGRVIIPVEGKPCSPALDHLEFVDVTLGVRVPGSAGIFQCWADECVTGRSLK